MASGRATAIGTRKGDGAALDSVLTDGIVLRDNRGVTTCVVRWHKVDFAP